MTKVKAGKIRNLTDARYFAAQGVDWLGINMDTSEERALTLTEAREILSWVEGPEMVLELGFEETDNLAPLLEELTVQCLQLNQFTGAADNLGVNIIREVVVEKHNNLAMLELKIDLSLKSENEILLLNFFENSIGYEGLGSQIPLQPTGLRQIGERIPFILAIAFTPSSFTEILSTVAPLGIELRGGLEEKTGFKSYDELDRIFEILQGKR